MNLRDVDSIISGSTANIDDTLPPKLRVAVTEAMSQSPDTMPTSMLLSIWVSFWTRAQDSIDEQDRPRFFKRFNELKAEIDRRFPIPSAKPEKSCPHEEGCCCRDCP